MHKQKCNSIKQKVKNLDTKKMKIDKKCPFLGKISLRGKLYIGTIKSINMKASCIVRIDSLVYLKKYKRFMRSHKNIPTHVSLSLKCKKGDTVLIAQNRSISKTIRFNIIKVIKRKKIN
mmetsp:Transcript_3604/g.7302  ORF Transcript_3604/g.7302 Transcript_3604/m.7302 type:complete len:119 (+) Transcript_3604:105-461(+)